MSANKEKRRSTVGVSGLAMEQIVEFINAFLEGLPENPWQDIALASTLNYAVDDLKAYYYEAPRPHNRAIPRRPAALWSAGFGTRLLPLKCCSALKTGAWNVRTK